MLWTVGEAQAWIFESLGLCIGYSTIFTPLIILTIVNCWPFNEFNCNRDLRTVSSYGLYIYKRTISMNPLTVRPFISLDIMLYETWIELSEVFDQTLANNYSVHNVTVLSTSYYGSCGLNGCSVIEFRSLWWSACKKLLADLNWFSL